MTTPPTLSEMQHALADPVPVAPSTPAKGKKKGRGGGDFDESKVKRDGDGMFARKPAPLDGEQTNAQKDAVWFRDVEQNDDLSKAVWADKTLVKSAYSKMAEIKARTGIDLSETGKASPEVNKARTEYSNYIVAEINKVLTKSSAAVSPSGEQRVRVIVVNPNTPNVDFGYKLIKNNLKHDDVEPPSFSDMVHILETEDDVLEHFGIKGMKWGVRRSAKQLAEVQVKNSDGTIAGGITPSSKNAGRVIKAMRAGETMVVDDAETGTTMVLTKQADGTLKRAPISADAERFLKTLNKTPDQMSDAELKAATNRAKQLQSYNQLFGADNKSAFERQVDDLALQKRYRDLQKELNPPKKNAINQLVSASTKGFATYKEVDKLLNGDLSSAMSSKLGLKPPMSAIDRLKLDSELTTLRAKNIKDHADLNEATALYGIRARPDRPSQARDYNSAGKRRARQATEGKRQTIDIYNYRPPA